VGPTAEELTLLKAAFAVWRALCARRAHFLQRSSREAFRRCHALVILLMDQWVDGALPASRAEVLRRRRHARVDLASKQQRERPASAPAALDQPNRRAGALAHSALNPSLHSTPSRSSLSSTPSYPTPNSTPSPTPALKLGQPRRTVAAASVMAHQHDTPVSRSEMSSLARRARKGAPLSKELQLESPCSEEFAAGMQVPTPPLVESFSFSDLTPEAATDGAATEAARAPVVTVASYEGKNVEASSPQRVRAAIKSAQGLAGMLTKSPLQSNKLSANSAARPSPPSPSATGIPHRYEGTGGTATPDGSSPRLSCDSAQISEQKVATPTPSPGKSNHDRPSGIPLVLLPTPLSRRSRNLPRAHKLSQEMAAAHVPPKRPVPASADAFPGCENGVVGFEGEHIVDNDGATAGNQAILSGGMGSGGDILRFFKMRQTPVS